MGAAIAIGCIIAAEGLDRAEHAIDEHRFGTDAEERRRRKKVLIIDSSSSEEEYDDVAVEYYSSDDDAGQPVSETKR